MSGDSPVETIGDLRTLVVDDNDDQRQIIMQLLAHAGITDVVEAADAEVALARSIEHRPHLILLDLAMPGRSGFEVLPELVEAAPHALVVVVSHRPRHRLVDQLRARGAVGFVDKGGPPERFVDEVLFAAALTELVERQTSITLPAEDAAARAARRMIRQFLAAEEERILADAELLVSELVTNSVVHAASSSRVEVRVSPAHVHVAVHDHDPTLPHMRDPDPMRGGGRGLRLVDGIADRWGAEVETGGKFVWFEIDRR